MSWTTDRTVWLVRNISFDQFDFRVVLGVLEVMTKARTEIVNHTNFGALRSKGIDQMRPNETRTAGDEASRTTQCLQCVLCHHGLPSVSGWIMQPRTNTARVLSSKSVWAPKSPFAPRKATTETVPGSIGPGVIGSGHFVAKFPRRRISRQLPPDFSSTQEAWLCAFALVRASRRPRLRISRNIGE